MTRPLQLTLTDRGRFCPARDCFVPCGAGIPGLRCTCLPCRCNTCQQRSRRAKSRHRQAASFEFQMRAFEVRPYQPRLFAESTVKEPTPCP